MATNYVLVDFENVQPNNLEALKQHTFKVMVFVGANQTKVPFDLAAAMQVLGDAGQYIKVASNEKTALYFHIGFYVGELAAKDPGAYFHIISRDAGFDTLIKYLKARGINIQRERDLDESPVAGMSTATSTDDMITTIVENLAERGQSMPQKINTLSNTINSLFAEKLPEQQLDAIVKDLEEREYIKVSNGNVSYQLPHSP